MDTPVGSAFDDGLARNVFVRTQHDNKPGTSTEDQRFLEIMEHGMTKDENSSWEDESPHIWEHVIPGSSELQMVEVMEGSGVYWYPHQRAYCSAFKSWAGYVNAATNIFFSKETLAVSNAKGDDKRSKNGGGHQPLNPLIIQALVGKVCSKFAKDSPPPSQVIQKINMKCVEAKRPPRVRTLPFFSKETLAVSNAKGDDKRSKNGGGHQPLNPLIIQALVGKVCSKFAKDSPPPSQVIQKINMKCVEAKRPPRVRTLPFFSKETLAVSNAKGDDKRSKNGGGHQPLNPLIIQALVGKVCSKFAKDSPPPSQVIQKINMKCVEAKRPPRVRVLTKNQE
ncbi:hypothetical protein ACROYT_G006984 [Oculina patagonica]